MALQDTIKGWPWYGQAIFFGVIAGALFYFGDYELVQPKKEKINTLKEQLNDKNGADASSEAVLNKEVELLKHQNNLLAKLDELMNSLEFLDKDISQIKDQKLDLKDYQAKVEAIQQKLEEVRNHQMR